MNEIIIVIHSFMFIVINVINATLNHAFAHGQVRYVKKKCTNAIHVYLYIFHQRPQTLCYHMAEKGIHVSSYLRAPGVFLD